MEQLSDKTICQPAQDRCSLLKEECSQILWMEKDRLKYKRKMQDTQEMYKRIEHKTKVHANCKNKAKMISCNMCQKSMIPSSMLMHLKMCHSSKIVIQCKIPNCYYFYCGSEEELKHHEMLVHKIAEKEQCIYCDLSYPSRASLRSHLLLNHLFVKS
jgi:hypothetical protein